MSARTALTVLWIGVAWAPSAAAQSTEAWRAAVARTISETCAVRGLSLDKPLSVLPMDEFQGGYTPGIGSVTWEDDHARTWREGWCALGVYCTQEPTAPAGGKSNGFARPAGLYDRDRNVLFVRDVQSVDSVGTVAHEAVHALQYQRFPDLNAIHLWRNRDLAAAANSVVEGDAHVIGWSFDATRRALLCSADPASAVKGRAEWWNWQPDGLSALEAFPHVFGLEPALKEMLARGNTAMDRMLHDPPLSTLAVLRPGPSTAAAEFIRLADEFDVEDCTTGLRNTAGVVGIWGLLRLHGDAEAAGDALPAFLEAWRGDRFVHLACAGDQDDELAWLTRWRTPAAASEFAARLGAIAAAIPGYGGVLGSEPEPVVEGRTVVVVTAGLRDEVARIADSETKVLATFDDWIDSGCFPDQSCADADPQVEESINEFLCADLEDPPGHLDAWLDRVRHARQAAGGAPPALTGILDEIGRLAAFCAVNGARNPDLLAACRATYSGARYIAQLDEDANYRLLPYCLAGRELRDWLQSTYYADHPRAFASQAAFASVYGVARAAEVLADAGAAGLRALVGNPPLSTLALLRPGAATDVAVVGLRQAEVGARGCEITASHARGALAIWNLLMDYELAPEEDALPPFLAGWRGDRQFHIRCAEGSRSGWAWISHWRTAEAAATFAARYRELAPLAAADTELPVADPVVEDRTVWIIPDALKQLEPTIKAGVEVRDFADFSSWVASGCFPQQVCN